MNNYGRGRRFEWKLAAQLKAEGAIVMRSAGSHGEADLVAMWQDATWAIQAKTRTPTAAEVRKIAKASELTSAVIWMLVWPVGKAIAYRSWINGAEWKAPMDHVDWVLMHKGMAGEK